MLLGLVQKLKSKRGISIMIGYVLLVVAAIALSAIVYVWMKSYVPTENIECPDGVSVFISKLNCEPISGNMKINLTVKNNGRFSLQGLVLRATTREDQEIADKDLSEFISGDQAQDGIFLFPGSKDNNLEPGEDWDFIINTDLAEIKSIEITPSRVEIIENRKVFSGCTNARVKQDISCI